VSAINRRHFLRALLPLGSSVDSYRVASRIRSTPFVSSALPPSKVAATTDQALSGRLPRIDGYQVTEGAAVLLTAQRKRRQNGPWIAHTTGWMRPYYYPSRATITGCLVPVSAGDTYASTVWQMAASTPATIDVTATTWNLVGPTAGTNAAILQRLTIDSPPPGNDWSYTVPAGTWLRLLTGAATLTTSSTAANRRPGLRLLDSQGTKIGEMEETAAVPASIVQKVTYSRSTGWNQGGIAGDSLRTVAVTLPALILLPGYTLQSLTPSLQPDDQYSATETLCETWTMEPLFDVPGPMLT
jgi:hypothetical protein